MCALRRPWGMANGRLLDRECRTGAASGRNANAVGGPNPRLGHSRLSPHRFTREGGPHRATCRSGGAGKPALGGAAAAVGLAGAGEASGIFEDGKGAVDLAGFLVAAEEVAHLAAGDAVR